METMEGMPIPALDHEFASLRLSSLTQACSISPLVSCVTIGPRAARMRPPPAPEPRSPSPGPLPAAAPTPGHSPSAPEELVQTPHGAVTLSRALHAWQLHLRDETASLRDAMLAKMAADRVDMLDRFRHDQQLANQRKGQERLARELEIIRELATDDRLAKIEQERLDLENKARSERLKKVLEKQIESEEMMNKLEWIYSEICNSHREIFDICSEDSLGLEILGEHNSDLSHIVESISGIRENCNVQNVTEQELLQASTLLMDMENLKNDILICINKAIETAKAELFNLKATPDIDEVKNEPEAIPPTEDAPKEEIEHTAVMINEFYSPRSYNNYLKLQNFLSDYENSYKQLLEDPSLKQFRFDCQKAVNIPVNAISSTSGEQIRDKYNKLSRLLNGERVIVDNGYISATQHPQGLFYCMDLLARKIIKQGELLVSSKPEAAFPIASVCIALWARFPDFGKLLCARFQKVCPYLIPMILPQFGDQSDMEFYKSRGYTYNDEGEVEKQDKFLKRMSGVFTLYASIWVTKMPNAVKMAHPQNLSDAWRWLAAFVNLKSEPDISATLLFDFLTVCGNDCNRVYTVQFFKILKYLTSGYFSKSESGGPQSRLDIFLQDLIRSGHIPPPVGMISSHFW